MRTPEHRGIEQNKTADRLTRKVARIRPIGVDSFLSPYLSMFLFKKKKKLMESRKQTEWKNCRRCRTSHLCLEGLNDRYVRFMSKLDRKHCRMLAWLLTRYINLQYMPHNGESKNSLVRKMRCRKRNIGAYSMWISDGKSIDYSIDTHHNTFDTWKTHEKTS